VELVGRDVAGFSYGHPIDLALTGPEAHALHHGRDVHAYNYGSLPIVDIKFGTFRNPRDFVSHVGFSANAPRRLGAMLLGRDVSSL